MVEVLFRIFQVKVMQKNEMQENAVFFEGYFVSRV